MKSKANHPENFVRERSCTNIFCAFIFFFFLLGWGLITFLAFEYGDPEQIFLATDNKGGICGRGIMKDKNYLFYFNILKCAKIKSITSGCKTNMVCISNCPNYTESFVKYKEQSEFSKLNDVEKDLIKNKLICDSEIEDKYTISEIPSLLRNNQCASVYFKSEPHFGRCIPVDFLKKDKSIYDDNNQKLKDDDNKPIKFQDVQDASKAIAFSINAQALGEQILQDISVSKEFILYGLLVGMVVCFIWIILMQMMAGFMIWSSMILLIFVTGFLTYFSFHKYKYFSNFTNEQLDELETEDLDKIVKIDFMSLIEVQINSILTDKRVWLVLLIFSGLIFFLLSITFIALRQRVKIAISLIKEASKAIMSAKLTLFFPIFPYIFQTMLILFAVVASLLIAATSKPAFRYSEGPNIGKYCDPREPDVIKSGYTCKSYTLLDNKYSKFVQLYNLFGFFWVLFFIHGMCQLIFAGVFSRYYWTFDKKKNLPYFLITTSTYTAFRYHIGSVAIGSFLRATLKIIQVIIEYIDKKCKQYSDNAIVKSIIWCMRCFFWLLDNFLRFINTNAYIMIAVYGKGYFSSAKEAASLVINNFIRAAVIDKVADYLLMFGKLCVTAIMAIGTFYVIENYSTFNDSKPFPKLNFTYTIPIGAISLGTYMIASSFFSVYEMAVNTIFLCFLKDCDENDGSSSKPYFMSKELLRILNYQNKILNKPSERRIDAIELRE